MSLLLVPPADPVPRDGLITWLADLAVCKLCFVTAVTGLSKVPRGAWDRQKLTSHQPEAVLKWL